MKKLILIIGAILIALNTLIGFIISGYEPFNYWLANLSFAISIGIIYAVSCSKMADGFKIGLSSILSFTGVVRFFCMVFAPAVFVNNILLVVTIVILCVEVICVSASVLVSKKG